MPRDGESSNETGMPYVVRDGESLEKTRMPYVT